MACDKGPLDPHHVLILPVEHQRSSAALPSTVFAEVERYLAALRSCFAAQVCPCPPALTYCSCSTNSRASNAC